MWSLLVTVFMCAVVVPFVAFMTIGFFGKLGWPLLGLIAAVVLGLAIINEQVKKL